MKPQPNHIGGHREMAFEIRDTASWLEAGDLKHLIAAQGYAELGMFPEAKAELEEIDSNSRQVLGILAVCAEIYRVLEAVQTHADCSPGT